MFYKVLKIFQVQKLYKRGEEDNVGWMAKMAWKTGGKAENQKRDLRERSLRCSEQRIYYICSYTSYITNIYVDVGKLPNHLKLLVLYLFTLYQFLLCFITKQSPMDWDSSWQKLYLWFYYCHILSSYSYIINNLINY